MHVHATPSDQSLPLQTPYECEANSSSACRAVAVDFYGVALANYYVSQFKWPGNYSVDALNQVLGPADPTFLPNFPQYGPSTAAPSDFMCVPSMLRRCMQVSNESLCASSGCQWFSQCLPDPCTNSDDSCCGRHGSLCAGTTPEVWTGSALSVQPDLSHNLTCDTCAGRPVPVQPHRKLHAVCLHTGRGGRVRAGLHQA